MNLAKELLYQIADPSLSVNEQAKLRCALAKRLEEVGNYEGAREALGILWPCEGECPVINNLDETTRPQVLLRVGALTGYIGSIRQISGFQEMAKDLLSKSLTMFEMLQDNRGVAEGQIEMAVCYWREGALDEARVVLEEALSKLDKEISDLRAVALLRSAIVEKSARRYHDALRIHVAAAPLFESSANAALKGKFHHLFGFVLRKLGGAEQRRDYIDRALIEYAAASIYFEEAGLSRHQACVENNLGFLFGTIGKFAKAHEHLDRAQALFTTLKDLVHLAQVDDTRSRVMLAQGRVAEALKLVDSAVRNLEKGGEQSLLAEALTTQGIALARSSNHEKARAMIERAAEIAEQAGDPESAGHAALVLIEELGSQLSNEDLVATIERAEALLEKTQDMASFRRLAKCACRALALVYAYPARPDWTTFSLKDMIHRYEANFLRLALKESGGRVTKAAQLLGLPGHQTLLSILTRHQNLSQVRTPITPRGRSIIRHRNAAGRSRGKASSKARTLKILHVEDDPMIAGMVKETLALEGWEVDTCADGNEAMKKLSSHVRYDLLLLDYELPGMNGGQLVQHARSLFHRRRLPIITLSSALDEDAARKAGADALLRKPDDISAVTETITRLMQSAKH